MTEPLNSSMCPTLGQGSPEKQGRQDARVRRVCALCSAQCPTPCGPTDCSPPGSSIRGILQQESWSGLPFLFPGDLPDPGIKPRSPAWQVYSLLYEPLGKPQGGFYSWKSLTPFPNSFKMLRYLTKASVFHKRA